MVGPFVPVGGAIALGLPIEGEGDGGFVTHGHSVYAGNLLALPTGSIHSLRPDLHQSWIDRLEVLQHVVHVMTVHDLAGAGRHDQLIRPLIGHHR